MYARLATCVLIAAVYSPVAFAQSPTELRALMHEVLEKLETADENLGDYAYLRHNIRREFDSEGTLEEQRTIVAKRDFIDGYGFIRQIERNGQPVPEADIERELAAFRQSRADYEAMSPAERRKLQEQQRKEAEEARAFIREFPEALNYRMIGEEMVNGRVALVLECEPRPGYEASNMRARVFEKTRGKIWIDKAAHELVRVDAEVFDTVNIGWGLIGKIQKGTRFHLERSRVDDGVWLPQSQTIRFTVRVLLFKTISQEETTRYSAYVHKTEPAAQFAE